MDILLGLHNLSLSLGQRRVLDGISLNIVSGDIHALMADGKDSHYEAILTHSQHSSERTLLGVLPVRWAKLH